MKSITNWFKPTIWRTATKITKINAKDQYHSIWYWILMMVVAVVLALTSISNLDRHSTIEPAQISISRFILLPAVYLGIGILGIQYKDITEGKLLRMRLLPNGIHVYGLALITLIIAIFGPILVAGVALILPVVGVSHWLWVLKLVFAGLLLMLVSMPWIALLGSLIRGVGSYMAVLIFVCCVISLFTLLFLADSPPQLTFLPTWLNPQNAWHIVLAWLIGAPAPHFGSVLLAVCGFGLVGYLVFALAFPSLTRSAAAKTSKIQQTTNSFSLGKGW